MTTMTTGSRHIRDGSPRVVIKRAARLEENSDFPRSRSRDWKHDLPVTEETNALAKLKVAWDAIEYDLPEYEGFDARREFLTIDLDDFEIYISSKQPKFPYELTTLEFLDVRGKELLFDGILSIGDVRCYVQGVPINVYSIEAYGKDDIPSAVIYIQSQSARHDPKHNIWYRLRVPSRRYARYHRVFQWVATLGKHTIDFLETRPLADRSRSGLDAFRHEFYSWLTQRFHNNEELKEWLKAFGGKDFRKSVHAHIDYLSQEAYNLGNARQLLSHQLWADCMRDNHHAIIPQPIVCKKTTTTPHTYLCFKNRYFAEYLQEVMPSDEVRAAQERMKLLLGFPRGTPPQKKPKSTVRLDPHSAPQLMVGDVVSILPDEVEERLWRKQAKDIALDSEWYAYIQRIETNRKGEQRIFVIWLYRPEDTTISTTDYPITKELFMSDHCNCREPELLASEVARRCTIDWDSKAMDTRHDFLVRRTYLTEDSSFVSLRGSHFQCDCAMPKSTSIDGCLPSDSIYVTLTRGGKELLEPVVLQEIDRDRQKVIVRRLLRLHECSSIPGSITRKLPFDNELVWTDFLKEVSYNQVSRKCNVRCFARDDVESRTIPFPYNRGGAGDYWMLTSRMITINNEPYIEPLQKVPASLNQSPDFNDSSPAEKLRGLSLFSGCGNLDKGLEEGGAVEFETAVEMCPEAVHSLHANARSPEKLNLWLGSVDDYLKALLTHKDMKLVARIGTVAVIAAGSPCPGFSTLQQDWKSAKSLRNASHVTTFCSFVETYRPKYAFLENVVNMACTRVGYEEERVLSQIIACLVSMGYQVRQFIMSAWNYGSPQHRARLILSIAAPGLTLLTPPPITHSNPENCRSRTIGDLLNGQKFGAQEDCPTPLPFVTAEKATAHLPDIGTGVVQGCIKSPDHRLCRPLNQKERAIIKHVPKYPPGQGLAQASKAGLVPEELYAERKEIGKAYTRIKKDGLIPTVITKPSPHDARAGAGVHWAQDRSLTLEESRIAQGIPPEDVLIGSVAEQVKQAGNAVDRRVSEQLGLALRRALEQCSPDALNAAKISARTNNGLTSQRRSLVCVKIPVSSRRTNHSMGLLASTSSTDSELNEVGAEYGSSSGVDPGSTTSFDSRPTAMDGRFPGGVSSRHMQHGHLESSPSEESDSLEPGVGANRSITDLEIDSTSGILLPSRAATSQGNIFRRLSESWLQTMEDLDSSLSSHSVVAVRQKRPRDDDVSPAMVQGSSASHPEKRAKLPSNWSPLVALPSDIPTKEPVSVTNTDELTMFERTVINEADTDTKAGKQESPGLTQHSWTKARGLASHELPPKPQSSNKLQQPNTFLDPAASHQLGRLQTSSIQVEAAESPLSTLAHSLDPKLSHPNDLHRLVKPMESRNATPDTSRPSSAASRTTRQSGLPADAGPMLWSKVPEREIRKAKELAKELARRGSLPYA